MVRNRHSQTLNILFSPAHFNQLSTLSLLTFMSMSSFAGSTSVMWIIPQAAVSSYDKLSSGSFQSLPFHQKLLICCNGTRPLYRDIIMLSVSLIKWPIKNTIDEEVGRSFLFVRKENTRVKKTILLLLYLENTIALKTPQQACHHMAVLLLQIDWNEMGEMGTLSFLWDVSLAQRSKE